MKALSYFTVVIVFTIFSGCSTVSQKEPRAAESASAEIATVYWKQHEVGIDNTEPELASLDVEYTDENQMKRIKNITPDSSDFVEGAFVLTGVLAKLFGCTLEVSVMLLTTRSSGPSLFC